jgi:hypothetical protein
VASDPEIVDLAREHLGGVSWVYFAPSIPPDKEAGARSVHGTHLPGREPILVLYDATAFGGAEDGFVLTPERLCWKNLLEHPRQVPWGALDPAAVVAERGRILVAGGGIALHADFAESMARVLLAMAARYVPADAGPYRSHVEASAARATRLVSLARSYLGEVEPMYYCPAIPPAKLSSARAVHAASLAPDEPVAVLYDDTVFGSAKDGFLVTPSRLCWKNFDEAPAAMEWAAIEPERVRCDANRVHLAEGTVRLTAAQDYITPSRVADLFQAIAVEARGGRA